MRWGGPAQRSLLVRESRPSVSLSVRACTLVCIWRCNAEMYGKGQVQSALGVRRCSLVALAAKSFLKHIIRFALSSLSL